MHRLIDEENGAERFQIGTPSPVICENEIASSQSTIAHEESPRHRVGDLGGVVADQAMGHVLGETKAAVPLAAAEAASHIANSLPSNPFTSMDERLKALENKMKAYSALAGVTDDRSLESETALHAQIKVSWQHSHINALYETDMPNVNTRLYDIEKQRRNKTAGRHAGGTSLRQWKVTFTISVGLQLAQIGGN